MKLFTKQDIECAARLAIVLHNDGLEDEVAVGEAVSTITDNTPPYYDETTVKTMLRLVAPSGVDINRVFEDALNYLRK